MNEKRITSEKEKNQNLTKTSANTGIGGNGA